MMKYGSLWFLGMLYLTPAAIFSQTVGFNARFLGNQVGGTIGLGAYQTYANLFIDLKHDRSLEVVQPGNERMVYGRLLRQLLHSHYLAAQITFYPLASLSSYLHTDRLSLYNRFYLFDSLNALKSISSGPEEPYALSLFWGNIVVFAQNDAAKSQNVLQTGSAIVGLQISGGHWHIQDNFRIRDWWVEPELRLKGVLNEPGVRKISWNGHIGVKLHSNPLVADVVVLGVMRDRSDYNDKSWSISRNSFFELTEYIAIDRKPPNGLPLVRHLFRIGKKYPLTIGNRTVLIKLGVGGLWEWVRRFNDQTRQFSDHETGRWIWLIQPNIEF